MHSNGFSLIRKIYGEKLLSDENLRNKLLTPTKIYVKPILSLIENVAVKGIAHITGGGFYENIPRALPKGLSAKISYEDVKKLPIFDEIMSAGGISRHDMFNTFNMGVGMIAIVSREEVDKSIEILKDAGEDAYVLGEVIESDEGVILC